MSRQSEIRLPLAVFLSATLAFFVMLTGSSRDLVIVLLGSHIATIIFAFIAIPACFVFVRLFAQPRVSLILRKNEQQWLWQFTVEVLLVGVLFWGTLILELSCSGFRIDGVAVQTGMLLILIKVIIDLIPTTLICLSFSFKQSLFILVAACLSVVVTHYVLEIRLLTALYIWR
ncbi:hypothetical protein PQ472_01515 [Lacticaseibacillus pabuli]|uniref:Uncharacterized protein n=1 Tax=Lacticaseibacillus pabuli TaxID=3025672 RepID=A0ABY7WRY3_9LACO|nr:hypothetical protein [Lacticaseibacillus sp. KACC 23028]WDF82949.1 hypothetical protein PQ472_01515 [Lacticaseibacillus sp. KACC 23028]